MTAVAKQRLQALNEQLVAPNRDQMNFESIPVLKKIAPDSNGPRVKGKVIIVTGQLLIKHFFTSLFSSNICKEQTPLSE